MKKLQAILPAITPTYQPTDEATPTTATGQHVRDYHTRGFDPRLIIDPTPIMQPTIGLDPTMERMSLVNPRLELHLGIGSAVRIMMGPSSDPYSGQHYQTTGILYPLPSAETYEVTVSTTVHPESLDRERDHAPIIPLPDNRDETVLPRFTFNMSAYRNVWLTRGPSKRIGVGPQTDYDKLTRDTPTFTVTTAAAARSNSSPDHAPDSASWSRRATTARKATAARKLYRQEYIRAYLAHTIHRDNSKAISSNGLERFEVSMPIGINNDNMLRFVRV